MGLQVGDGLVKIEGGTNSANANGVGSRAARASTSAICSDVRPPTTLALSGTYSHVQSGKRAHDPRATLDAWGTI
jgi:hypothetical protein